MRWPSWCYHSTPLHTPLNACRIVNCHFKVLISHKLTNLSANEYAFFLIYDVTWEISPWGTGNMVYGVGTLWQIVLLDQVLYSFMAKWFSPLIVAQVVHCGIQVSLNSEMAILSIQRKHINFSEPIYKPLRIAATFKITQIRHSCLS